MLLDAEWRADLAFAVDATAPMNEPNAKLQCESLFVHDMYGLVKAFMRNLQFLSSQLENNTLTHLPAIKAADNLQVLVLVGSAAY